jgi:twitching motility protein PilT
MLADQLFKFLTRADVKEIALHTGRPPCALVDGSYRRLSAQLLKEDDIIQVLSATQGHQHLTHLAEGRTWEFAAPGVGEVSVSAVYDAQGLKVALRLQELNAPVAKRPSRTPRAKRPSSPPRRSARPPRPASPQRQDPMDEGDAPHQQFGDNTNPRRAAARPQSGGVSLPPPAPIPEEGLLSGSAFSLPAAPQRPASRPMMPAVAPPGARPPSRQDFAPPPRPVSTPAFEPPMAARAHPGRPALDVISSPPLAAPAPGLQAARPVGHVLPPYKGDHFDDLLRSALEWRASDLHVIAERPPLFRLAGELVPHGPPLSAAEVQALLMPRVPQERRAELETAGSCDFALQHPVYGRFRVNVSQQRTGLKLTARLIGADVPTLEELGMPQGIRKALHHHQGLIVVTGPTGHGKTTTMAAIVGIINRETTHHVITVEDPIEYTHGIAKAVISQREVGRHTKTFAAALKASLREDPDVIVVGELRDTETVRMALSASETGHLVISTMNTPSAAKAIERLIDLFPPGDQPQVRMTLAGGLRLIISQRLLPTADRKQLCAAAELLPGSTALWSLIRDNRTYQITSLQQRGKSLGIIRLDDSLAELVRSGRTTVDIAKEYAEAPHQFDALVAGRPVAAQAEPQAPNPAEEAAERAGAAAKRGLEMGKNVLSRAGKLFGNETK